MARIKLTPTTEPKSIVAEEKSLDSRSIVVTQTRKTSEAQRKARDKWNVKQAQIAIRVKPEIKAQFDEHCKSRGESLAAFLVRAGISQIERDTTTKSIDMDTMLSE